MSTDGRTVVDSKGGELPLESDAPYGCEDNEAWRAWANSLTASKELGMVCRHIDSGTARFALPDSKMAVNPNGASHGGLVAAAIDQAMGIVSVTVMPDLMVCVTSTLNLQYHLPSYFPLSIEARVARSGRALIFVDVEVRDCEQNICVRGQGTMVPRRVVTT